jgi:asparaginyl-tRNA synthetase
MKIVDLKDVHAGRAPADSLKLQGWIRSHRQSKQISFIEFYDGTSIRTLQLVIEPTLESYASIAAKLTTGSAIEAIGVVVDSPAKGQKYEFRVSEIHLVGEADPEKYPLQKKGHTLEFLREIQHLRPRTNTLGAVFRIRSAAAFAIHKFFIEQGFQYVHTPIITTSDCEGAGELFRVTTLDITNPPKINGAIDFQEDFFKSEASLTVSGQLEGEIFATALKKVYTFGPTFRAENSNTPRHLAEFWMIEPEVAFLDLEGNMALAEAFIKYLTGYVLEHCEDDLAFLHQREWVKEHGLMETLRSVTTSKFETLDYSEAVRILENSGKKFDFPVKWGMDLQTEHERYLTDEHVKGPVFVVNYPKAIKAFYMKVNDDGNTVRAMDLLTPRLGEIIGGSQREERHDVLLARINELGLPAENYWWYLELRKFGSVPHAGFGLGFERFLMYVTGIQNIRDVIPIPRYPGFAKF